MNLGQYLSTAGRYEEALAAYREGLKIKPDDEYIHYNMASLLQYSSNSKKAFLSVNEAILSNPERGVNFWLKGRLHAQDGDHHAAIQSFWHAILLMEAESHEEWNKVLEATHTDLAQSLQALGKTAGHFANS